MLFEEMLRDERREGKVEATAESVVGILAEMGSLSDSLREKIMEETELSVLKKWLKLAIKAESIEQFEREM